MGNQNDADPCENHAVAQTIVVLGGRMQRVPLLYGIRPPWNGENGPNLNDKRCDLVTVVCRDKGYTIGGYHNDSNNCTVLDTMESIQVSSLMETTETSTTRQDNSQSTRLQCGLSSPQKACAAVVVHDRYVVILGGHTRHNTSAVASVEIVTTTMENQQ